jgi:hypothetical protein
MRFLSSCHQVSQMFEIGGFLDHLSSTYKNIQFSLLKRKAIFPSLILMYKPSESPSHTNISLNSNSLSPFIRPMNRQYLTCLCIGFMQLMSVRLQAFSGLLWADCYSSCILSAPERTGPNQDDSVSFIYLLSVSMTFSNISTLLYKHNIKSVRPLPTKIFSCIHYTRADIVLKTACVCKIPCKYVVHWAEKLLLKPDQGAYLCGAFLLQWHAT